MPFKASLVEFQAEASCPMCLDYLRDPVTADCGHNFCGSCIHQCWEDLQDILPCPVCLHHCPDRNLKRNIHFHTSIQDVTSTRSCPPSAREEPPSFGGRDPNSSTLLLGCIYACNGHIIDPAIVCETGF
uniref:RING-type domain-containing protein n=1 Tax=Ursus americanus TaxID=9643 RepID=A0A452RCN6_URSAM